MSVVGGARAVPGVVALTWLFLWLVPPGAQPANQLAGHASPYLAMHAQDPVDWQDWGEAALAKARAENKLLFVSSGYFACHWCHVMQRESYRDAEIAALLNRHFVPVKVDRELHPALDAHLIDFVERTQGVAGWPLNVFLTPEGYPLVGMTYVPPGRFRQVLETLRDAWEEDRSRLADLARRAAEERAGEPGPKGVGEAVSPAELRSRLTAEALTLGDELEGGFGRQSRFPMEPQLQALLDLLEQGDADPRLRRLVGLTLDRMAGQGMRDHLGGGFFRYTVDPGWQIPHYEKMLYTNAQLIALYLRAAEVLGRPEYREVARDTLDFVLKELAGRDGGFIASLSAVDANRREGGCYLWQPDELQALLPPLELEAARLHWRLHGPAPTDGGYLPVPDLDPDEVAAQMELPVERVDALLSSARAELVRARADCEMPRDGKQLAAWNGLMLSALAAAGRLGDPRYRRAGRALRDYLRSRLWAGKRLLRAARAGKAVGAAALEDYAYVAAGLHAWAQAEGEKADVDLVLPLVEEAWQRFYTDGAWRDTDELLVPGQASQRSLPDGAMPSPSATLIELSLTLARELGRPDLAISARRALAASAGAAATFPFVYASDVRLLIAKD